MSNHEARSCRKPTRSGKRCFHCGYRSGGAVRAYRFELRVPTRVRKPAFSLRRWSNRVLFWSAVSRSRNVELAVGSASPVEALRGRLLFRSVLRGGKALSSQDSFGSPGAWRHVPHPKAPSIPRSRRRNRAARHLRYFYGSLSVDRCVCFGRLAGFTSLLCVGGPLFRVLSSRLSKNSLKRKGVFLLNVVARGFSGALAGGACKSTPFRSPKPAEKEKRPGNAAALQSVEEVLCVVERTCSSRTREARLWSRPCGVAWWGGVLGRGPPRRVGRLANVSWSCGVEDFLAQ